MTGKQKMAINGACILIKKCLGLDRNDVFLLVYDETTRHFPPIFRQAAEDTGVTYHETFVKTEIQAASDIAFSELRESLKRAKGVLLATTDDERCSQFRIVVTGQLRDAGNALATMPGASVEILSTALDVDYDTIVKMCRDLTVPLIKARQCKITTVDTQDNAHIFTFELGGMARVPIQSLGIIPLQAWGNVPAGETFVAPIENSADGEYLVNGAIGNEKVTGAREAVIQFEKGRMVRHYYVHNGKPVHYLTRLQETAEKKLDGACWNIIAEFGVGVNKQIPRIMGVQLIDEKKYGTVHVAIGHNAGYGGRTKCQSVHCDMTTVNPTVELDGRRFIDRGEHVYDLSPWLDDYRSFGPAPGFEWKLSDTYVKLNEGSYELTASGILLAKHTTQSGRQTIYSLGNDVTAKCAYKLIRSFDDSDLHTLTELQTIMAIPVQDLVRLLSLLLANGIIYP